MSYRQEDKGEIRRGHLFVNEQQTAKAIEPRERVLDDSPSRVGASACLGLPSKDAVAHASLSADASVVSRVVSSIGVQADAINMSKKGVKGRAEQSYIWAVGPIGSGGKADAIVVSHDRELECLSTAVGVVAA